MTWNLFRWVWRLEAPLSIGMPPAGALNRCRLYVPARVLWGAITAAISRMQAKGDFPTYEKVGKEVEDNIRFTYLYPAEKINGDYLAWLPEFKPQKGLIWRRQDGKKDNDDVSDREFRRRLLDARPGTAIEPRTDSASEGTLRETECLNPWWRVPSKHRGKRSPVFLVGYVFLKNDNRFRQQMENIKTLFVGGDTRYGLGKIRQAGELSESKTVFGKRVDQEKDNPEIQSNTVWGHALEDGQTPIREMRGIKEFLGGWEQGRPWKGALAWAPGSSLKDSATWSIDNYGYWTKGNPINSASIPLETTYSYCSGDLCLD